MLVISEDNKEQKKFNKILKTNKVVLIGISPPNETFIKESFSILAKIIKFTFVNFDLSNKKIKDISINLNLKKTPTTFIFIDEELKYKLEGEKIEPILDKICDQIFIKFIKNETHIAIMKKIYGIGFDAAGYKYYSRHIEHIANEYLTNKQQIRAIMKKCEKKIKNKSSEINYIFK